MGLLTVEGVTKDFSGTLALSNVSLHASQGTIFGLLGPNGAGKTTLIRIINQIIAPDSGTVYFDGVQLTLQHIHNIGYLPEERGLYKKMKVGEQALFLAQLKGMSKKEAQFRLTTWFKKLDIESWWNRNVDELSKGMQQKVQFIVAVLHEPKLLIFDEPFSGFDPINANTIKQEIIELKKKGATIVLSTHTMSSVEELCDEIALMNHGKIILDGQVNEIKKRCSNNTFEIQCVGWFDMLSSTLTHDYKIVEHKKEGDITTLILTLLTNISTNDLLKHIMGLGTIISFKEILPSMNDIFITTVEQTNAQQH